MSPTSIVATTDAVLGYLRQLLDSGYWGSVSLRMEGPRGIVHVYREESIKPESLIKQTHVSKDDPYAHRSHTK
jgi:hypothetical protein